MSNTIHDILDELRQSSLSERDKGDKFERLFAAYLRTDPQYKDKYSDVWLWMDWSDRVGMDTGIDIVAKERDGSGYCAIQCKFYDSEHILDKGDIDSFFTASGKHPFSSRMIVFTGKDWGPNARQALVSQQIPVATIGISELENSPVDWSKFSFNDPSKLSVKPKKILRPHQKEALDAVSEGFAEHDRGKLIMACGTGKTFTALKIAEYLVPEKGCVLFLVPSIYLLSQTLREWSAESERAIHAFAVCSDEKVGKHGGNSDEDIHVYDLAIIATTNAERLSEKVAAVKNKEGMTVIFSTYQSIEAVAQSQRLNVPEFDLIICDEAHRTTGVTLAEEDESQFVKIHQPDFIRGKKRLYMTATPRLYSDDTKSKAADNDIVICSMDDENLYGPEFHRLGFGDAVTRGLLSDYKVMVLAVSEDFVNRAFQMRIASEDDELSLDDAIRIIGCWNGLSKKVTDEDSNVLNIDPRPMRRAVAFSRSIKDSIRFKNMFAELMQQFNEENSESPNEDYLECEVDHVDGSFNAMHRNRLLDWLKEDTSPQGNVCRILSNARCLSEGVDVPALDAVMFLNPRNSVVDVVQSVGRVMRKAEGKKYGYIILPVGIPSGMEANVALSNNKKYKIIWQVLQALRAHDDRFNSTINKLDLNKSRPQNINVIGVGNGGGFDDDLPTFRQMTLGLEDIEDWRDAIYARMVKKCGDRLYWENWAKDVADIADRHIARIRLLIEDDKYRKVFDNFLKDLQGILNPSIGEDDAIEMLSQHMITKPVFDALFEGYEFTKNNPISKAMQKMLDILEEQALDKETQSLEKFYESVKRRASGIDNLEGKQRIVIELYDTFFRTAFPKMAERLGIVYTPVEVVDFIVRSADYALRKEFGVGIADEGVHVIDPFTGTGTFIVRLLQSGLIPKNRLPHKYRNELHANEIILLAYYLAAINIEETYHLLTREEYEPFKGIVLTDTFQLAEVQQKLDGDVFTENVERVKRQKRADIRVVMSNPPYSSGQTSENDNNKNLKYSQLDAEIRSTYAANSTATLKNSLYDSYIRAFRWASDRIKQKGVICFVSNGSFIDNNAMDGFRKCLMNEFSSIYCFNLRGNQRTSGETSRKEGGKIFASGSRATIAITLLIKKTNKESDCNLYYYDIGDYFTREEKLAKISSLKDISNIDWEKLIPNDNWDWINQRNCDFDSFIPLGNKKNSSGLAFFQIYSAGIKTNRDAWAYNFSQNKLINNMSSMIIFYNEQVMHYKDYLENTKRKHIGIDNIINSDPNKIKWSFELKEDCSNLKTHFFEKTSIVKGLYRPFMKQWTYFNKDFNNRVYLMPKIFPNNQIENLAIYATGIGAGKGFSALITNVLPNLHTLDTGQCFPLYTYEKPKRTDSKEKLLFGDEEDEFIKRENIPDSILMDFHKKYNDKQIIKEDIFYYVYGILHSQEYREKYAADLKKMLPRIPFVRDFHAFSKAGRELAQWHINYETIEPYPLEESGDKIDYHVTKMEFAKKTGREKDKTTIIYNGHLKFSGIPMEAYEYIVNGKSALEWIIERYQITVDKDSGIKNDPNDWSDDPRYIPDLVKRIVRVSVETVRIVRALPKLEIIQ